MTLTEIVNYIDVVHNTGTAVNCTAFIGTALIGTAIIGIAILDSVA